METEEKSIFKKHNGEIVDFTTLDSSIQQLIRQGIAVRENSYSPYSNFKVGAALLSEDGTVFTGCNVENASYPAGICAERSAVAKAVSEGKRKFQALVVVADNGNAFTSPCGICRQTIVEFGNMPVYLAKTDMKNILKSTINELLPYSFSFEQN